MSFEQHLRDLPTQIIAPVAIGTTKYQMLVDTGAGSSALDLSIAKESVTRREGVDLIDPNGGATQAQSVNTLPWRMQSLVMEEPRVTLVDLSGLRSGVGGGFLGCSEFLKSRLENFFWTMIQKATRSGNENTTRWADTESDGTAPAHLRKSNERKAMAASDRRFQNRLLRSFGGLIS